MMLPAFAAERQCLQLSVDISCPQCTQQQTRRLPLLLLIDWTDGWMDAGPLHGPCCAYYAGSVNNNNKIYCVFSLV